MNFQIFRLSRDSMYFHAISLILFGLIFVAWWIQRPDRIQENDPKEVTSQLKGLKKGISDFLSRNRSVVRERIVLFGPGMDRFPINYRPIHFCRAYLSIKDLPAPLPGSQRKYQMELLGSGDIGSTLAIGQFHNGNEFRMSKHEFPPVRTTFFLHGINHTYTFVDLPTIIKSNMIDLELHSKQRARVYRMTLNVIDEFPP